jgi:hypothetical protein
MSSTSSSCYRTISLQFESLVLTGELESHSLHPYDTREFKGQQHCNHIVADAEGEVSI